MRFFAHLALLLALTSPARAADLPDPVSFSVAVEAGDLARARAWLDAGLSPDFEGRNIGTGIMIGAWEGNIPMMELFLARGADVNKANALGEQALLHAAWKGQLAAVRWLVEHGARLNRRGKQWAALHYATFAGHDDVVGYLLERGADVNAVSTNGSTPLMMAAREGKEDIATRLLAAGARPDVVNDNGEDATKWALRNNNTRIARLIAGEEYARAAAAHAASTPAETVAQRSVPLPSRADALLAQARKLEAAGKRVEALKLFRAALSAIREADTAKTARVVTGLNITAKRGDPTVQGFVLQFAAPTAPKVSPGKTAPGLAKDAAKDAAPVADKAQASAEDWLRRARELEAAGKRREALDAFRRAASALRGN